MSKLSVNEKTTLNYHAAELKCLLDNCTAIASFISRDRRKGDYNLHVERQHVDQLATALFVAHLGYVGTLPFLAKVDTEDIRCALLPSPTATSP